MANHRKKCGALVEEHYTTVQVQNHMPQPLQGKVEMAEEQTVNTLMWTSNPVSLNEYIDESVHIDKVINDDIKRHRKSGKRFRSDSQSVDATLSSFLIGCNLTFDVVDSEHFKKFVTALNPDYVLPSSAQLKNRVLSRLSVLDSAEKKSNKKRRYYESSDLDTD